MSLPGLGGVIYVVSGRIEARRGTLDNVVDVTDESIPSPPERMYSCFFSIVWMMLCMLFWVVCVRTWVLRLNALEMLQW